MTGYTQHVIVDTIATKNQ